MKNSMNSSFSSNNPGAIRPILNFFLVKNSYNGKELNKFCPPKAATTFAFSSVFILLLRIVMSKVAEKRLEEQEISSQFSIIYLLLILLILFNLI